ncbi:MAG: pyrroline-5-carboxylate reductase [Eubacteriales bacterium]
MNIKVGFIGCGNMAQAMIKGIIDSKLINKECIYAYDPSHEVLDNVKNNYGIHSSTSNSTMIKIVDIVIFAIKPNILEITINEIKNHINEDIVFVSIAAGKTINAIEKAFNRKVKVVRTMPNSGVQVGEGMTAICNNPWVKEEELDLVVKIFNSFGKTELLEEKYFDGITAVSGSSPASVYMFIEALADAAVRTGIPRNKAYTIAAQTVLGSAKTVLETGKHPGELKDMVCSPGGTSIEAVYQLETGGFRGSILNAIQAATEKSKSL